MLQHNADKFIKLVNKSYNKRFDIKLDDFH